MKKCSVCKLEKNYEEFYKHPINSDGYFGKCKECTKKYANDRLAKLKNSNIDSFLAEERRRDKLRDKNRRKGKNLNGVSLYNKNIGLNFQKKY